MKLITIYDYYTSGNKHGSWDWMTFKYSYWFHVRTQWALLSWVYSYNHLHHELFCFFFCIQKCLLCTKVKFEIYRLKVSFQCWSVQKLCRYRCCQFWTSLVESSSSICIIRLAAFTSPFSRVRIMTCRKWFVFLVPSDRLYICFAALLRYRLKPIKSQATREMQVRTRENFIFFFVRDWLIDYEL